MIFDGPSLYGDFIKYIFFGKGTFYPVGDFLFLNDNARRNFFDPVFCNQIFIAVHIYFYQFDITPFICNFFANNVNDARRAHPICGEYQYDGFVPSLLHELGYIDRIVICRSILHVINL